MLCNNHKVECADFRLAKHVISIHLAFAFNIINTMKHDAAIIMQQVASNTMPALNMGLSALRGEESNYRLFFVSYAPKIIDLA